MRRNIVLCQIQEAGATAQVKVNGHEVLAIRTDTISFGANSMRCKDTDGQKHNVAYAKISKIEACPTATT